MQSDRLRRDNEAPSARGRSWPERAPSHSILDHHARLGLTGEQLDAPPRRRVGDERRVRAQQIVLARSLPRGLLVVWQLLDPLERVAIQPVRAAQTLGEQREALDALLVVERRLLGCR